MGVSCDKPFAASICIAVPQIAISNPSHDMRAIGGARDGAVPPIHSLQSPSGNFYSGAGKPSNKVHAQTITSPKPFSILVVDDDAHFRRILCAILEGEGYACTEAEDGLAALKKFYEKGTDFIITDFHMPNMNGCEFLEKLSSGQTRLTPAIMITGHVQYAIRKRAMLAGVLSVLSKPFDRLIMLDVIQKALKDGKTMFAEDRNTT